jgi:hypothetical protein
MGNKKLFWVDVVSTVVNLKVFYLGFVQTLY